MVLSDCLNCFYQTIYSGFVFLDQLYTQGLIQKIRAASNIDQKEHFFEKKIHQKFHHPLFNLFFKCSLYQNKALYNFHKRGQLLTAGHIKGLDQGLIPINTNHFTQKLQNFGGWSKQQQVCNITIINSELPLTTITINFTFSHHISDNVFKNGPSNICRR